MIAKVITTVVSIFGATVLFWAGIAYEHRPKGWPSYAVHCCVVVNLKLGLPESLGAQLADAQAALRRSQTNEEVLRQAIDSQNAAIRARSAAGAEALANAEEVVSRAQAAQVAASKRLAVISAPIAGDDVCARVKAFDETFTGALRP